VATDQSGALILSVDANKLVRIDENGVSRLKQGWVGSISSVRETRLGLLVSDATGLWRAPASARGDARISARWLARRRDFDVDPSNLWAFGVSGVERIAISDLEKAWRGGLAPMPAMVFDWSEGLAVGKQETGFRGRQIVAGSDGRIWLLTRAGPYVIDSRNIIRNTIPPPLTIRALWANERRISIGGGALDLPAGTRSVRMAYSALSYSMPDRVQFKYRLVGVDDQWINAGNRHEVTFGNLGPGNYRFEVIGANEDGVWNSRPASLAFRVAPNFVQSIWFKLGVMLLLLIAAITAYQWRTHILTTRIRNALSERSAERDRIARELHDTLLQSVQALILRFQLLVDRLPDQHPSRRDLITTLDQADEVLAESRQRVLDLRARHPRSDLKSVIAALVKRQLPASRFKTAIHTTGKIVLIDSTVFNALVDVANECLFNILRHAQASKVTIEIGYDPLHLELEIADNGIGLDAENIANAASSGHFGLVGMKERIANLGGQFVLRSEPGTGVSIIVRIPSTIAYRTKNTQTPEKEGGWRWLARQAQELVSP
jgi:signal transduction histidine kinase